MLAAFFAFTVPLMPVQALLLRLSPRLARALPHWYHRKVCRILGLRLEIDGQVQTDSPVLLIANHSSWLDIPVLSAVAPVSFVAKREVGSWPFVSSLARLQRSVFVDRTRRQSAASTTGEIAARLRDGDAIVLFAEGTSSDGNRVLPFKTSLFGAVEPGSGPNELPPSLAVQTIAVVYTHRYGIAISRADRPRVNWYGDMEMLSHAWGVLKGGPLTATITIGPPESLSRFKDRKEFAIASERQVRRNVTRTLRHRAKTEDVTPLEPGSEARRQSLTRREDSSGKWT